MKKENKHVFKILKFGSVYEAPVYKFNKQAGFVTWGADNRYPNFLVELYNNYGSPLHKAIINKKTKLVAGQGFDPITDPELMKFIDSQKVEMDVRRAELDYELFNGFAFEIIWNNEGTAYTSFQHIPFHKLRIGIENDEIKFPHVWFSNDWKNYKKPEGEPEMVRTFNPLIRKGKQIYYYAEYNPFADGLYPIPGYSNSINWIENAYEISKFHVSQAKNGYAPSFILNFATGIPTEEEQDEFSKEFKRNFAGTENAGNIILSYSDGGEQKPELIPIQLNDSDERFIMLMDQIDFSIVSGHEIPGAYVLLQPGKLGSTEERTALGIEFQKDYISPRQTQLEGVVNEILGVIYTEEVKLKKSAI